MSRLLADSRKEAQNELAAIDARVAAFAAARDDLRWHERSARREIERRIERCERQREHWRSEAERLTRDIEARPAPVSSPCSRAIDPLAGIEPRARKLDREDDLGIER